MKQIQILFFLLFAFLSAQAQTSAPIRAAAKLNVSVASGGDPYTLTVSVLDDLSRFSFADFGVGDSVYLIDGSDLLIYVVTSKLTSPNRLVVDDVNNTGISAPTGQGAIVKSTVNYKLPFYISGLRDDLRSMMMNRLTQLLDSNIATAGNEVYKYLGGTGVAPAVTAAVAGTITAQNTVGEIYTWNPSTNLTTGAWSIISGGGTTETASNGLTKTGNDIRLGGALTAATTVTTTATNTLSIAGLQGVGVIKTDSLLVQNASTGLMKYRTTSETWDSLNIKDGSIAASDAGQTLIDTLATLVPTTTYMKTLKRAIGAVVNTQGFTIVGDGGGARYVIENSGTVDNMTVFQIADGKYAKLQANSDGGINILQLGAIMNSATNQYAKIQKAINSFDLVYCYNTGYIETWESILLTSNKTIKLGSTTEIRLGGTNSHALLHTNGAQRDSNITIIGGIWNQATYARTAGSNSTSNGFTDSHCFVFHKTKYLKISGCKIINVLKFGISLGDFDDANITNITFHTFSDGVHAQGAGKNLCVSNIYGHTEDDFVAVSGSDYAGYNYSEGNIDGITIRNLYPQGCGNICALFPGSSGTPNFANYTFSNVVIENVFGYSTNASCVFLGQYSINKTDPAQGETAGGIFRNVSINNVFGIPAINGNGRSMLEIGVDTLMNISINNVKSSANKKVLSFDAPNGYINKLSMSNISNDTMTTGSVNILDFVDGKLDEIVLDNIKLNTQSGTGSLINFGAGATIRDVSLVNSFFKTTGNGVVIVSADSIDLKIANTEFNGINAPIDFRGLGQSVTLNAVDFYNCSYAMITRSATATLDIYPQSYKFNGAADNFIYHLIAGATATIQPATDMKERYIRTSSNYTLPQGAAIGASIYAPIGQKIQVRNIGTTQIYVYPSAGTTVNALTSIPLASGDAVTIRKTGLTTWETETQVGDFIIANRNNNANNLKFNSDITNASNRNWALSTNNQAYGDLAILQSTAQYGDPVSAGAVKMYFKNDGKIGIGNTAPTQALDVTGTIQSTSLITNGAASGGTTSHTYKNGGTNLFFIGSEAAATGLNPTNSVFYAYSGDFNILLNNTKRFSVQNTTGNIGINNAAPLYKVDIDANTSSTGNPIRLQGLQVGATTDSILTSSNGIVRRLSIAEVVQSAAYAIAIGTAATDNLTTTDYIKYYQSGSSTTVINFPSAITNSGKRYILSSKKSAITLTSAAGAVQDIAGTTVTSILTGVSAHFISDGTNWIMYSMGTN